MALSADGAVYTWGNGSNGKLGDNNTSSHNAYYPQRVVRGVADTYTSETVATQASSTGDETTDPEPVVEEYLSGILEISAGKDYALALDKNGHVLAWGTNTNSKLGLNYRSVTDNMGVPSYVVAGCYGKCESVCSKCRQNKFYKKYTIYKSFEQYRIY